ncbi:MAG: sulfotransferase family 2 domain-containing protein [Ilumatobacteraceae bacterium]
MTIECPTLELVYYDVPKVACTSLKTLFWEINHDRPFRRPFLRTLESQVLWRLNVALPVVHRAEGYLTTSFAASGARPQGYESFVVVRDPIARLRSAWRDKVSKKAFGEHDELDEMRNELLPSHPDLGTFINYFDEYRQISKPARQHTRELTWHLGPDLAVHDHVFRMEELPGPSPT